MIKKVYPATKEALIEAIAFVEQVLVDMGCEDKEVFQITVSLDEMFINITDYAYANHKETGTVEIMSDYENGIFTIELIDEGIPFNPLEKADPDVSIPLEDRAEGGLGIFMVKKCMDEVSYRREENQNIFTMKKHLKKNGK